MWVHTYTHECRLATGENVFACGVVSVCVCVCLVERKTRVSACENRSHRVSGKSESGTGRFTLGAACYLVRVDGWHVNNRKSRARNLIIHTHTNTLDFIGVWVYMLFAKPVSMSSEREPYKTREFESQRHISRRHFLYRTICCGLRMRKNPIKLADDGSYQGTSNQTDEGAGGGGRGRGRIRNGQLKNAGNNGRQCLDLGAKRTQTEWATDWTTGGGFELEFRLVEWNVHVYVMCWTAYV